MSCCNLITFRKFQTCDLPGLEMVALISTPSILHVSMSTFLPFEIVVERKKKEKKKEIVVDGGSGFCKQCSLAAWSL